MNTNTITTFKAKLFKVGKNSQAVVVPKSKFNEGILLPNKEYDFYIVEVKENETVQ